MTCRAEPENAMFLSPSFCLNDLAPKDARMALETVRFAEEELKLAGKPGNGGLIHDDLVPVAKELGFSVSYDTAEFNI